MAAILLTEGLNPGQKAIAANPQEERETCTVNKSAKLRNAKTGNAIATLAKGTKVFVLGGGIYSANTGIITLNNSIIANSTSGGDCNNNNSGGNINASYSLIEDNLTCLNGTNSNNLTGDPNLGPLQNNGGPTFTHALLAGSSDMVK